MQGLACAAPQAHALPLLATLTDELCRLGSAVTELLARGAKAGVSDADSAVITGMAQQGGHVLRLLRALQAFRSMPDPKMQALLLPPMPPAAEAEAAREEAASAAAAAGAGPSSSRAPAAAPHRNYRSVAKEAFSALPNEVKAALASAGTHLEPLWAALSACISAIEDSMGKAPGAGTSGGAGGAAAGGAGGAAAGEAGQGQEPGAGEEPAALNAAGAAAAAAAAAAGGSSSRTLPPGAGQVLPLVEAFFVMCALRDAIPAAPTAAPAGGAAGGASTDGGGLAAGTSSDMSALAAQAAAAFRTSGDGSARGASPPPAALAGASRGASGQLPPAGAAAGAASSAAAASAVAAAAAKSEEERTALFMRFAERHRRLMNAYLRRAPALLEGSLSPLMSVPRLIDFDNKRSWFRTRVRSPADAAAERPYGSLRLAVRREHVFEDSFYQLRGRPAEEMRLKLNVTFQGEEGIDAGGVTREWYQVMAREMFNPNLALFVTVPEGGSTFQPNPNSHVQNDRGISHLDYFRFVGRVVGKALYDGQLIDAYFTRSFYKHMLGSPLTHVDLEAVDPEYYKALSWMLSNDITDVLDLTFTAETDFFGRKETVELVPGGKDLRVTEANKLQYVNLVARHRMTTSITAQINAFLEGFWQLVPRQLISIFNDHELELLISGLPDIDVDDLRANTEYSGYSATSPVIRWFWEAVGEMDKQERAQLVQFVTGTSKVPLEGFKALQGISGPQKFQIHKAYGDGSRLPSAHTCFNQLDLPEYESKEQLVERLKVAVSEGNVGFGFG